MLLITLKYEINVHQINSDEYDWDYDEFQIELKPQDILEYFMSTKIMSYETKQTCLRLIDDLIAEEMIDETTITENDDFMDYLTEKYCCDYLESVYEKEHPNE